MSERISEFGTSASVPLGGPDTAHMTAGDMLREAREAHGLHIDMVAAALKVSTQKLAALEADDIDALPDPVFARALAASVCRALRIDPAPVLAKLPGAPRAGLADADRTISRSLRSNVPRSGNGGQGLPSRALLGVVVLLLAGAAVLFWLPQSVFDQIGASFSHLMSRNDAAQPAPAVEPTAAPAPDGGAVETVQPAPPAAPAPQAAASAAAPVAAAAVAPAAVGSNVIVFTAREDSWITVSEAGGKPLLRRTVKGGETVGVTGSLPLAVVVGRASVVDVQVRGKPYDLAPLTHSGGVARFEVKP
ncbi:Cytoskeleton protein RodZ [Variovorax sp. SRS16]|uniref:helix-turn-helix domain-containing protein n=1 Tax=Variovorax sp. SRS16 TaxID=282217 RepID=UPI001316C764|nr:helix-turn-helix domain-containing protein [Variovorax sp. SRS16]VTU17110.1 Cytoskeleton protein RodZ [Variovorax sp. SRS16]